MIPLRVPRLARRRAHGNARNDPIVRSERLVLQIACIIDSDDVAACIADWFIARDVRLSQNLDLPEVAFVLRNGGDGLTLWVENGADRPGSIILLNVRCHADELVAAF